MPEAQVIQKAILREVVWTPNGARPTGYACQVQFNPQSLKVAFANQSTGGDQRGGGAIQFVGKGSTKLSLDLLFDATAPLPDGTIVDDVRELTQKVAYFMKPKRKAGKNQYIPPGVRFIWGSFLFEGIMDSLNETLEFFSNAGKPLRGTLSVSFSRQDIYLADLQDSSRQGPQFVPGTLPLEQTRAGDTVQQVAARRGHPAGWVATAAANGIENPRSPAPGTILDAAATGTGASSASSATPAGVIGSPTAGSAATSPRSQAAQAAARLTAAATNTAGFGGGGASPITALQAGVDALVQGAEQVLRTPAALAQQADATLRANVSAGLAVGTTAINQVAGALQQTTQAAIDQATAPLQTPEAFRSRVEQGIADLIRGRVPGGVTPLANELGRRAVHEIGAHRPGSPQAAHLLNGRSRKGLSLQAIRAFERRTLNRRNR